MGNLQCQDCGRALVRTKHPDPVGFICIPCDQFYKRKVGFNWKLFLAAQAVIFLLIFLVS